MQVTDIPAAVKQAADIPAVDIPVGQQARVQVQVRAGRAELQQAEVQSDQKPAAKVRRSYSRIFRCHCLFRN